jgi:hypothetical protein
MEEYVRTEETDLKVFYSNSMVHVYDVRAVTRAKIFGGKAGNTHFV